MTDHIPDEGRRIMALAALRLTQARARAAVARMLLDQLRQRSRHLTSADAHDFAYAVWAEFLGDDGRAEDMPIELQASVFAKVAPWLDEETMIRLARERWGDLGLETGCGLDRVIWMPADELLIITTGHTHPDGTTGQVDMVVSPMRVSGWPR
ncbi:hypothetical protein [Microbacterium aurantiacum]|uniref:Uncharacterized protein n=1 Tax=Microbacterium aurantiacum TaxID=162393 RepID=A0ABT8FRT8_9MICO|nr:hypothetical protein [Microbacterium aurantiacum]MDN4463926.1 hypothetical protein [Microbacterium aurantiacum]